AASSESRSSSFRCSSWIWKIPVDMEAYPLTADGDSVPQPRGGPDAGQENEGERRRQRRGTGGSAMGACLARRGNVGILHPGHMARPPYHVPVSRSSARACINMKQASTRVVVAPWRRFHLDCYIDGGRGSWVYPLRVAGSKDLWPTRHDCSFFITAPTVT